MKLCLNINYKIQIYFVFIKLNIYAKFLNDVNILRLILSLNKFIHLNKFI